MYVLLVKAWNLYLVSTKMDMRVPTSPTVEMVVRMTPSIRNTDSGGLDMATAATAATAANEESFHSLFSPSGTERKEAAVAFKCPS